MNRMQRTSPHRFAAVFLTAVLVTLGVTAAGTSALDAQQVPDPMFRDFELVGSLVLSIEGAEVPSAEVFQSERARAVLVMSSKLDQPLLVNMRSRQVERVSLMSLAKRADGSIDVLADATLEPVGTFTAQEDGVEFTYGGKSMKLSARESLTGKQSAESLMEYDPSYARGAESYEPNKTLVSQLEKQSKPVRVQVFFNSKCGVCKQAVPKIIKLDRTLEGSKIAFDYYGLPDSYSGDEEMERKGITGVPTGIVYVGGREVGRIIGGEWRVPELAIKNVLGQKG